MRQLSIAGTVLGALLSTMPAGAQNPLLAEWTGPFGGVPPFDRVQVGHIGPALEAAMERNLRAIDAIASDPAAPDFDNTIAEMERADRSFSRVYAIYSVWRSTMSSPQFQSIEQEMAPRLAAFTDQILQNERLFRRIEAVHGAAQTSGLTPEQQRLAWFYHTRFSRAGAELDAAARKRLSGINQSLAALYTRFRQNVLADESEQTLYLEDSDLAGLPPWLRSAAATTAQARPRKGKYAILNTRSSVEPFLTYSERRDLREKVWRTYYGRGDNGGRTDNKPIISEILALRAERARLLGYATHAHWRLADSMAATPEAAMALMESVWQPAVARVHEEVADMQAIAEQEGRNTTIEPWDYRYYAEKVRRARYQLDQSELQQYLVLDRLVDGLFWTAGRLFGLSFTSVTVPVYHPDVRAWQVLDASGRHLGLYYFDPYAREGKRSGAWMSTYRAQERFDGVVTPIVSSNANFTRAAPGQPVLISWDDATTLFHEFGHALHGLLSNVSYHSLAGTAVFRDFVEFPSQLLEHWLATPELLSRFARHHQTGQPMPPQLRAKIESASTFNQGFETVEYLSAAMIDMKLHLAGARPVDPADFEREELAKLGMPREIVMRHRMPQFTHVFSSDSYAAGYYSYLWADTLTADAFEAFLDGEGAYDETLAGKLYTHIFSTGNAIDPAESYRRFRGRDADHDALMRKRGFAVDRSARGHAVRASGGL